MAGVENTFGKATGAGVMGPVPKVSSHGPSPWKVAGDREWKEESRAVRLAITKLNSAISGNSVKKCEVRDQKTKPKLFLGKMFEAERQESRLPVVRFGSELCC